jgi:hypothetical protein
MLSLVYAGPKDEAVKAMAPILELGPSYSLIKEIPWSEISTQTTFLLDGPVCENNQIYDIYPVNLRTFDAPTLTATFGKMAQFWEENPSAQISDITIETWPIQATVAVPDNATAYPWRDTTSYM